jgi:hypothetical protein
MGDLKSTAVDATAMTMKEIEASSLQLRNEDIITELNAFYVEATGTGISEERRAELMLKDFDSLISIDKELRWSYSFDQMSDYDDDLANYEAERCDSIEYCEHEGFTGEY